MTLELRLTREQGDAVCVPGNLTINDVWECFTLERLRHDPASPKPFGAMCCVTPGRYKVEMRFSPHFKKMMPHLLDVPGRENILMHVGCWVKDSEGCILVGHLKGQDMLGQSADESAWLNAKLTAILNTGGEVWITIADPYAA
jgi:hypothetical protein